MMRLDIPLGRFLHWGPILAMGIFGCITFTTIHLNDMWWPVTTLASMLNKHGFICLSLTSFINFVYASLAGPGFLKLGWRPEDKSAEEKLQHCAMCDGFKAPRSHHCRKCGRCSMKMDHHCPWINTCVGWQNHAHFTRFLAFAVAGSAHASVILCAAFYRGINRSWYIYNGQYELATVHFTLNTLVLAVFSLGLAIGVVVAVGMLLVFQLRAICRNRTGIEDWILEKARFRRSYIAAAAAAAAAKGAADDGATTAEEPPAAFRHPYDLGSWRRNAREVLGCTMAPLGDGITWTLADGCDPYALTVEQLAQKVDKRARTRAYRVWRPATGSWLPLWSQGWRVAAQPPCTDEARIRLEVDDVVHVTRWKTHWLFGERVKSGRTDETGASNNNAPLPVRQRVRGWFPRRCVTELYGDDECSDASGEEEEEAGVLPTPSSLSGGGDGNADDNNALAVSTAAAARPKYE